MGPVPGDPVVDGPLDRQEGSPGTCGGVIIVHAGTLVNNGSILADGTSGGLDGYRATGGGSGGSIFLNATTMSLADNSVRVGGGSGRDQNCFNNNCSVGNSSNVGGNGGFGRARLNYDRLNNANFPAGSEGQKLPAGTPRSSGNAASPLAGFLGTAQSLGYDTGAATPVFTRATVTVVKNGGDVTGIQFSTSDDGTSNWSAFNADIAQVAARRFIRWKAAISGDAEVQAVKFDFTY